MLIAATIMANFLNLIFSTYLGRVLEFKEFALIGLMSSFLSLSGILFTSFTTIANFRSGFLIGKYGEHAGFSFWKHFRKKAFYYSFFLTIAWLLSIPILTKYFSLNNAYLFIFFGAILLVRLASSADNGFLSSKLMFGSIAIINLIDALVRLVFAVLLVSFGLKYWTFSTIPLANLATFAIGWLLIVRQIQPAKVKIPHFEITQFPKKFFTASILTGVSTVMFLTVDIILANHFLNPTQAGQYTLLSVAGKMVYFLAGLTFPFLEPLTSRKEGASKSSKNTFSFILYSTIVLALIGFIVFGIFGSTTVTLLYGQKAAIITPYLMLFTIGMVCYSVSRVFLHYYLIKRVYAFSLISSLLVIFQIVLITFNHSSISALTFNTSVVGIAYLGLVVFLHFNINKVKYFENNLAAFLGLSKRLPRINGKLNILVFNWRDIKHQWAGGAEVYLHELTKRWVKDGNSVTQFCSNGTSRPLNEKIDGVQIIRRGGFYTVYLWAFIYYFLKFRNKFDVILDCENGVPFFTPFYAKEPKFLLIHHVHQQVFKDSLKFPLSHIAQFLEAKLMPFIYRNVQVVTVSPSSKNEILKHKLTNLEPQIVYNGVNLDKFKPGEKSNQPLILYLGRIKYYKSLHILLKSAKEVLQQELKTKIVIAGDGEEKDKLIKYASRLKILDQVKFLGKVTEDEKIKLLQKAWVLVNPSSMEGWGITTIEANACGTPAIASDVPGLCDSVENSLTGVLIPYGNCKVFANKMLELILNKEFRENLSENSIKWANQFSWEKSAIKFYSLILKEVSLREEMEKSIQYAAVSGEN